MRLIVQRVSRASVSIGGQTHASIQRGLLVLVGFEEADSTEDLEWGAAKLCGLRIFPDVDGKMNLDIREVNGELLVVSQFTLHASTRKGNRPSFIRAAGPAIAIPLYEAFLQTIARLMGRVPQAGVFGADMQVELVNDGPVTILLDTKNRE